ncbi:glycosyltransferase [bacterium]|nr:glycosyltransferase [bacterium]
MHVLFVHQNFPAQFGHLAAELVRNDGWQATFVSQTLPPAGSVKTGGVDRVTYAIKGGAKDTNHYCSRTFENAIWHTHAVYEALAARPGIRPDLIVGHSGFGSTLFLRELYPDTPIVNYFEYFYRTQDSDMDFRKDFPNLPIDRLRARARNATLLLDLDNCDAGYSPTRWQRDRLPEVYRNKVEVHFDGVDTRIWKPRRDEPRMIAGKTIPDELKIVSYATRGMESMRGFDIFMKAANVVAKRRSDVLFVVAGQDRVCYGGDSRHTGGKSFKEWVLAKDRYDLSRFYFCGLLPPAELARLFGIADVHVYLTVPFVLSWSLVNAMACEATILASDTGPVRDMIVPGQTGLLTDFFDVDAMADAIERVLDSPGEFRSLGQRAREVVDENYSLDVCLPRLRDFYVRAANG